jgi:hypothetical protein
MRTHDQGTQPVQETTINANQERSDSGTNMQKNSKSTTFSAKDGLTGVSKAMGSRTA